MHPREAGMMRGRPLLREGKVERDSWLGRAGPLPATDFPQPARRRERPGSAARATTHRGEVW